MSPAVEAVVKELTKDGSVIAGWIVSTRGMDAVRAEIRQVIEQCVAKKLLT